MLKEEIRQTKGLDQVIAQVLRISGRFLFLLFLLGLKGRHESEELANAFESQLLHKGKPDLHHMGSWLCAKLVSELVFDRCSREWDRLRFLYIQQLWHC